MKIDLKLILGFLVVTIILVGGGYYFYSSQEISYITSQQQLQKSDITSVQLKWKTGVNFAGLYVAEEKGFYEDENIKINLISGKGDGYAIDRVAAGEVDFGVTGPQALIIAIANGQQLKAIAADFQKSPVILFAKKESGITKPGDMIGKTIGINPGTNTELEYRSMLSILGLNTSENKEVVVRFDMTPFFNDEVDVWPGYIINQNIEAELAGYDVNLILPSDYGVITYGDIIFTTDKMIEENPDLVLRFLRATLNGWQYALEHQQEAVEATLKHDVDVDEIRREHQTRAMESVVHLVYLGENPIGWMVINVWEGTQKILLEQNLLQAPINIQDVFTNEFVERVYEPG